MSPNKIHLEVVKGINGCSVIEGSLTFTRTTFHSQLKFLFEQKLPVKKTIVFFQRPPKAFHTIIHDDVTKIRNKDDIHLRQIAFVDGDHTDEWPDEIECYRSLDQLSFVHELILLMGAGENRHKLEQWLIKNHRASTMMKIDLNALKSNLLQFRQCLNKETRLLVMVKAFAYGSDLKLMSQWLESTELVDYFGVAYVDEGVKLREYGSSHPIMVLNIDEDGFETCQEYNLEPVIYSIALLDKLKEWLKKRETTMNFDNGHPSTSFPHIHVEIDTGMHRLGITSKQVPSLLSQLQQTDLRVQSVFSHLVASEDADEDAFTEKQASMFITSAEKLEEGLGYPIIKHLCNSAAIIRHPWYHFDMVRLGIGLYGFANSMCLQPAVSLITTLADIHWIRKGESIGYNRRTIVDRDCWIGTIRMGYGDGLKRAMGNRIGQVWIRGHRVPIVGNVCMDMAMIDLTDIPAEDRILNEVVEVFGQHISLEEVAAWCNTISYEILTSISQRVKRIYIEEK